MPRAGSDVSGIPLHILQKAAQHLQIIVLTWREQNTKRLAHRSSDWLTAVCREWRTQSRRSRSQSRSLLELHVKSYVPNGTALSIHNRSPTPFRLFAELFGCPG
jgi:hypothetical protein